jgi:predicted transglutaminase-like cysteine proteinase
MALLVAGDARPSRLPVAAPLSLAALCCFALTGEAGAYLAEAGNRLLDRVEARFGMPGRQRVLVWTHDEEGLSHRYRARPLPLLAAVNRLANEIPAEADEQHWQRADYWATPAEFVASGAGDCEDFAFAKYFALRAAGVAAGQLRFVYVKALAAGRIENHLVLAYYERPDAEPMILDNLEDRVLPARERPDLVPVFSFAGDDADLGSPATARRWRDLLARIAAERGLSKSEPT